MKTGLTTLLVLSSVAPFLLSRNKMVKPFVFGREKFKRLRRRPIFCTLKDLFLARGERALSRRYGRRDGSISGRPALMMTAVDLFEKTSSLLPGRPLSTRTMPTIISDDNSRVNCETSAAVGFQSEAATVDLLYDVSYIRVVYMLYTGG